MFEITMGGPLRLQQGTTEVPLYVRGKGHKQELQRLSRNIDSHWTERLILRSTPRAGPDRCRSQRLPGVGQQAGIVNRQGVFVNNPCRRPPHPREVCLQLSSHPLYFLQGTMDDRVLSSLCRDPASYCTFDEQKAAIDNHKSPRRIVCLDGNTYIHMVIAVSGHWVAVQVTISPFTLERFHGQTFFSSQLRYGPCCRQINNTDTSHLVVGIVQRVVDSHYRPVCWDYSSNQWYVDLQLGEVRSDEKIVGFWTILPTPMSNTAFWSRNQDVEPTQVLRMLD